MALLVTSVAGLKQGVDIGDTVGELLERLVTGVAEGPPVLGVPITGAGPMTGVAGGLSVVPLYAVTPIAEDAAAPIPLEAARNMLQSTSSHDSTP